MSHRRNICVVGLGYVGLPVLVAFGKKNKVIGLDINQKRIEQLKRGIDETNEVEKADLINVNANIHFTSSLQEARNCDFYIITVPTPVDDSHRPDLSFLKSASEMVGRILKKGDVVVYESTVYPGATEEDCLPILEASSGLVCIKDFGLGYGPERINPGDKLHTFTKIKKVIAASDPQTLQILHQVYGQVIEPGLHLAQSIKVAEASKVVENIQRDINISLMNELALIFDKMNIDTQHVLEAASTKWNFLKFSPGLVGGHCIGVDPYYLTYKAEKMGLHPQFILSGRRVNEYMGKFIAEKVIEKMIHAGQDISKSWVTIFGFTFKENCPDVRNTRVIDIVRELQNLKIQVQVADYWADQEEVFNEYQIRLTAKEELRPAQAIIFAVGHANYANFTLEDYKRYCRPKGVIIDIKAICPQELLIKENYHFWRL